MFRAVKRLSFDSKKNEIKIKAFDTHEIIDLNDFEISSILDNLQECKINEIVSGVFDETKLKWNETYSNISKLFYIYAESMKKLDMKKMKAVVDSGHPLLIYPCGLNSEDGTNPDYPPATARFIKWMNCDIYVCRHELDYFNLSKKLIKSKNADINYLAKIVQISEFKPHPNPEVTRMKCAFVDGYSICVGIDEKIGLYLYFPTSSCINPNLLSFANLYRHSEKNSNPDKKGFFEDNGRVTAIRLKGQISEGFLLPFEIFQDFLLSEVNLNLDNVEPNIEFDSVEHNGKEFWINKKDLDKFIHKDKYKKEKL